MKCNVRDKITRKDGRILGIEGSQKALKQKYPKNRGF
jgi:hypothetical protein